MGSSLRTTWPQGLLLFNCKQNPTHECWDEGLSGHEIIPCVLHEEFWSLQLFLFCKLQWVQETGFQNVLSFVSWIFNVTLQPSAKICDQREDEETRIPQPFFLKFLSGTCYSVKRLLLACLSLGGAVGQVLPMFSTLQPGCPPFLVEHSRPKPVWLLQLLFLLLQRSKKLTWCVLEKIISICHSNRQRTRECQLAMTFANDTTSWIVTRKHAHNQIPLSS